jgi:hypothetical protein
MTQRDWDRARTRIIEQVRRESQPGDGAEAELTMALQVLQHWTGHLSRERLDGVIRAINAHWQQQQ